MQVIPVGVELHNPNVCTICEERPEGAVIDTERWTPFNPSYPLNGRKYVCARCGDQIARLFGYQPTSAIDEAVDNQNKLEAEVVEIRNRVLAIASELSDFITSGQVNSVRPAEAQIKLPERSETPSKPPVIPPDPEVEEEEKVETRSYEEVFGEPEAPAPKKVRRTKSTVESKSEA